MFPTDWQSVTSLACVSIALAYVARRIQQAIVAPGKTSCVGCPSRATAGLRHKPMVTLDTLTQSTMPGEAAHQAASRQQSIL